MVVLVDEKEHSAPHRRFRQAPPIPNDIRGNNLTQSSRPYQTPRFDDYGNDNSSYSQSSRGASPYANGNGVSRHLDALRNPSSPHRAQSPMSYDQRGLRSASSSVKDFVNGPQASVDSFRI
jgi:hypothetical protein